MKFPLLHSLLLFASLAVVRQVIIYNNSGEIKEESDSKSSVHVPDSNSKTKKTPPPPIRKPKLVRKEPEEIFLPGYGRPRTLESRTTPNEKQKLIERIKDYTVKIVMKNSFSNSFAASGTGWFLDYEIPKDDNKYPTKWFVATNAHVVDDYSFSSDPYKQNPKIRNFYQFSTWDLYLYRWESGGYDEEIFRKGKIDFEDPIFWSSEDAKKYHPYNGFIPPSRDVLKIQKNWHRNKETPSMHIKIPDPKLLYAAIDELQYLSGEKVNYFMDFAVMEIDFPDEKSARRMTEQVYIKSEKERINFLDEVNENSQFYTAGYPGNSFNNFRPFGNYSVTRNTASNKRHCYVLNTHSIQMQKWNGKEYRNDRCYHELDNFYSGPGSSGSMVVDEFGTLLGLHSRWSDESRLGYIQPIRGKYKSCQFSYPFCQQQLEYDLITGSPYQRTSYKQQLLNYLPQTNTYLKNKYKWRKP